jgi:hypothetical protein
MDRIPSDTYTHTHTHRNLWYGIVGSAAIFVSLFSLARMLEFVSVACSLLRVWIHRQSLNAEIAKRRFAIGECRCAAAGRKCGYG